MLFRSQDESVHSLSILPNPVSNLTVISFYLNKSQNVSCKIFDMNGRLVSVLSDAALEAGENEVIWNAAGVNTGIYILQLQSAETLKTAKLIVAK